MIEPLNFSEWFDMKSHKFFWIASEEDIPIEEEDAFIDKYNLYRKKFYHSLKND